MSVGSLIDYVKDKKILILGFGREGRSTLSFIRRYLPEKRVTIGDKNSISVDDEYVDYSCGETYLESLGDFDIVFKSPGIAFLGVKYPDTTEITCQLDMFLRFGGAFVIGVTGTKGKTTTSTLTYLMLKESGVDAALIGNMGLPVLDDIESNSKRVCVIEMSSHQLEFTRSSPHIAVITNVYEEHLDHYETGFAGYVNAKLNIMRHQSADDFFIYNGEQGLSEYVDLNSTPAAKLPVFEKDSIHTTNPHLIGAHNAFDCALAAKAASLAGADDASIMRALDGFEGIPNRMEFVGEYGGVRYYNDSIATVPAAVEAAVTALGGVDTLIIGGQDRGIDYGGFIEFLSGSAVKNLVCLPDTGHTIADALEKKGAAVKTFKADDMAQAVGFARRETPRGGVCLMSPAAASYNVYRDFEEKGAHFKSLVRNSEG